MGLLQHYMQLQAFIPYFTTESDAVFALNNMTALLEMTDWKQAVSYTHLQEIKAKYEYADADYMGVVPDGILDIITEGRALHHCAGSSDRYWDRIERYRFRAKRFYQ